MEVFEFELNNVGGRSRSPSISRCRDSISVWFRKIKPDSADASKKM